MANDHSPSLSSKRRKARKLALQALYQWHMAETSVSALVAQFLADNNMEKIDQEYFTEVVRGVPAEKSSLDDKIAGHIDRELSRLTPIELAVLRMGTYELLHRLDVPYRVIINEGVELTKAFGATDGHKYVNGVLDKLAQELRITEVAHTPSR
ncbi:transcription antitermination factor NusB [Gynuella sunshinyii]|uniref:Transcription antitermination protein NusB n=1 Tax=Gynuella sunshinyii YC6258 TaxID=1445510 RepID=A0A0C5VJ67_9GAMM|nr:transcription antitermination factor NusB [Gynuella sunshinyii]AJQ94296.1 transcription termination factor [Gynuella sunshinyii YC6258]